MAHTKFEKIIIIGYGRVTAQVLEHVCDWKDRYGYSVEYIEHEPHPFSTLKKVCQARKVPFFAIPKKEELAKWFAAVEEEVLVLSASNNFLFPASVVEKANVTIVNFHNALLPRFPGRNAPSWVIYEGESETGITWHYVTREVDEGSIILQKSCEIGSEVKAYELADHLMALGYDGFCECFQGILEENVEARPQKVMPGRRLYRSKEVPGGGHFDTGDAPEQIYRLLRALDYGKSAIFPQATATHEGREIRILRYRKLEREGLQEDGGGKGFLYLPLDATYVLRLKYEEMRKGLEDEHGRKDIGTTG